jgi:NAD(P)-dependent dehydrogenase (short-subunit alcohol dehydrogenase family)
MDNFLAQKTALVTGGTRGIGYAVAQSLRAAGAAVAICGTTPSGVDNALERLGAFPGAAKTVGKAADVGDEAQVRALFEFVDAELGGGPDILINNAGLGIFKSVGDMQIEEWKRTLETNLNGAFYCSREALARMKQRGGGFIVNISSLAGKNPFAGGAAYNASKFGMNGFSEAMMLDHRYDNVRVSAIMPGSVDTEFGSGKGGGWKIAPEDVAEAVMAVLRMPERTTVSRVEMRPSKPRK